MFGFLKVVKPVVAKPGKLSDAILAGAMMRPQAFYSYTGAYDDRSCALAAAYEACTGKLPEGLWQTLTVPFFLGRRFNVPVLTVMDAITWNDKLGASREAIAKEYKRQGY